MIEGRLMRGLGGKKWKKCNSFFVTNDKRYTFVLLFIQINMKYGNY